MPLLRGLNCTSRSRNVVTNIDRQMWRCLGIAGYGAKGYTFAPSRSGVAVARVGR